MKIGIDIDDTLTNTKELQKVYWTEFIKLNPNSNYTSELPDNINKFGDDYISKFWDTYRLSLNYNCTFKDNVSLILHKLLKDNHHLAIITARSINKTKDLIPRLNKWFKNNNIPIKEFHTGIINKGKYAKDNNFDLLIDDSIDNCIDATNEGINAILFNDIKDYKGLQTTSWLELYNIICELNKGKN